MIIIAITKIYINLNITTFLPKFSQNVRNKKTH